MSGPWTPPVDQFRKDENVVQVKTGERDAVEWIEFSSGGQGIHLDVKDFAWAIKVLQTVAIGSKIEVNRASVRQGFTVTAHQSGDIDGITPKVMIIDEVSAFPDFPGLSFDFNITRNKREMENCMRYGEPFKVVDRVPEYTVMGVTFDKLPDIAGWIGAQSYKVELQEVEHELHIDSCTVVDFHVKDKTVKPKVDFHLHARVGRDYIVRDPETGGFMVFDENKFNEVFMMPRASQNDVKFLQSRLG
jgi:hypothetical protein